jgi:nicotinic acid mononucleotide adenylyltransferase
MSSFVPSFYIHKSYYIFFFFTFVSTKPSESEKFRVGTADLLDMLIENESNTDFTMAMGSDTFKNLVDQKWKRSDDIIKLLNGRIIVFVRKFNNDDKNTNDGTNEQLQFENVNEKMRSDLKHYINKFNQKFLDSEDDIEMKKNKLKNTSSVKLLEVPSLTSISSTSIRSTTAENIDKLQKALHPDVVEYIMKNKMYGFSICD